MEDKEVGERWRIYHDEAVVIELIRKLVEERCRFYDLTESATPIPARSYLAFRDFGIDPQTWK